MFYFYYQDAGINWHENEFDYVIRRNN